MKSIKVFCMSKNEYDLIEDFIMYYGYLFDYSNVIIIDNNSTNQIVLDVYKKYSEKGVKIYVEENYEKLNQGILFTKYMEKYKSSCDFLIGLDTDEFIFSLENLKNNSNPFDKNKILEIFESYNMNDTLFSIDSYPCSIVDPNNKNYINNKIERPAKDIIYFSEELPISENMNEYWKNVSKQFSRSDAFVNASVGNHTVSVSHGNKAKSQLGLLHFNSTGKKREFERSKEIIEGYKYFSTSQDLDTQINILVNRKHEFNFGHHKVNTYHCFLLKQFLINLFIKYIKRLPNLQELYSHVYNNLKNNTNIIEMEFSSCDEAEANRNIKEFCLNNQNDINNLIYNDESISEMSIKYNLIKISYLSELLHNLSKTY